MQNRPNLVEFAIQSKVTKNFYTLRIRKNTTKNRKDMFFFFLLRNNPYMTRIKAYKIDENKSIIYSISEFCPEGNLQEFLDRYDSLTEEDVLLIFQKIVRSVMAIHDNGYIHGDLRLETISMCQNTVPKLKTFKMRVVKDSLATKRGTPFYMPPEALLDLFRPTLFFFQKSFDNYALGVILYFMLHYKFPFYGNTYEELLINLTNRRIIIDPELSALSKSLLSILLSNDINLRKDTKAINQMLQVGIQGMVFSNFRKDVDTPLFEIYSPKIEQKGVNKKMLLDGDEAREMKEIVSESTKTGKSEKNQFNKEDTSIFNQLQNERNFYTQMETDHFEIHEKDEESEISSKEDNLFNAVLTMPETPEAKNQKDDGIYLMFLISRIEFETNWKCCQ